MKRFSLRKTLISSAMSAALIAGATLSGTASAVNLSEDGLGQVLLGPMYLGLGGNSYTTEVAIVNTRNDTAVKAKVVLRSQVTSAEVLDFICYLTPADVCRFKIINKGGQAYLYSDDDSIRSTDSLGQLTFASVVPVEQQLFDQSLGAGDNNEIGHIEVIGVYGVQGTVQTRSGGVTIRQGMSKFDLAKVFDSNTRVTELVPLNGAETPAVTRTAAGLLSPTPAGNIRSTDPTWIQLTGEVVMKGPNDRMGYRLPALAGEVSDNVPPRNTILFANNTEVPFDGRVISNPNFDARGGNQAPETAIGFNFGGSAYGTATAVYDNIIELESALARSHVQGTYEDDSASSPVAGSNRTRLVVTFPTKYRHFNNDVCRTGLASNPWSPPFQQIGTVPYGLTQYDNQENEVSIGGTIFSGGPAERTDTLNAEVNYFLPSWKSTTRDAAGKIIANTFNYESGWFSLKLTERAGCPYVGLPTLSFSHKHLEGSNGVTNSTLVFHAHKPELANRDLPPYGTANVVSGNK
jgi:hypothetical protein